MTKDMEVTMADGSPVVIQEPQVTGVHVVRTIARNTKAIAWAVLNGPDESEEYTDVDMAVAEAELQLAERILEALGEAK